MEKRAYASKSPLPHALPHGFCSSVCAQAPPHSSRPTPSCSRRTRARFLLVSSLLRSHSGSHIIQPAAVLSRDYDIGSVSGETRHTTRRPTRPSVAATLLLLYCTLQRPRRLSFRHERNRTVIIHGRENNDVLTQQKNRILLKRLTRWSV